jgi:hypothetical protein
MASSIAISSRKMCDDPDGKAKFNGFGLAHRRFRITTEGLLWARSFYGAEQRAPGWTAGPISMPPVADAVRASDGKLPFR